MGFGSPGVGGLITLAGVGKRQSLAGISGAFTTREAVWLDSSSSSNMSDHTTQLRPTHTHRHTQTEPGKNNQWARCVAGTKLSGCFGR